jgi:hypothetical protein
VQLTDYVDKDVTFTHKDILSEKKVTSDRERILKSSQDLEQTLLFNYYPGCCIEPINHERMAFMMQDYKEWDLLRGRMSDKLKNWCASLARVFSIFDVSHERLAYSHRLLTTTFLMDDPVERGCKVGAKETFVYAFIANLKAIFTEERPVMIDLQVFLSDRVDQDLIDAAKFAQDLVRCNNETGKQVMPPGYHAYNIKCQLAWFDTLKKEADLFDGMRIINPNDDGFEDTLEIRRGSIGYESIVASILPDYDKLTCSLLPAYSSFVDMAAAVTAIDNDLTSAPKEKGSASHKQSESNVYHFLLKQGKGELAAAHILTNLRNRILMNMEEQIFLMNKSWRAPFQVVFKHALMASDYNFCVGHGHPNPRYGFSWRVKH